MLSLLAIFWSAGAVNAQNATTDSVYFLEENVTINRVFLMGNKVTQERIITRELSFDEGEQWAREALEKALVLDQRKLMNLRLFNTVALDLVPVNREQVDVVIRLVERWYIWPSVTFDLGDRSFNEWWYNQGRDVSRVVYGGNLDWYNVRGANEHISLNVKLGFTEKLRLAYKIPYIDESQKTGLSFEASYTTNSSINYRSENNRQRFFNGDEINYSDLYLATTLSRRPDFYNTHYLKFTYNDRTISDTIAQLNPNFFLNGATRQQYFRITYQLTHDRRDFASYPLEGQYGEVGLRHQGFGITSDFYRTEVYMNYAKYWALDDQGWLYIANRISGRTSFPELQPYNLTQTLGYGKEYVRGYETNVIEGQHYLLNRTNVKHRALREVIDLGKLMPLNQFRKIPLDIYLKAYYDQGYVWNSMPQESNQTLSNRYLHGIGFGVDLVTWYDVVLRVEYTRNGEGDWNVFYGVRADL